LSYDQKIVDRVARDLREKIGAMAVLVTKVEHDHQVILGGEGLAIPPEIAAHMPLDLSICQHVKAMDFPLLIEDVMTHPLLTNQPMIRTLGIMSYLGAPYRCERGKPLGALCVLERSRRTWTDEDLATVVAAAKELDGLFDPE